jgi:hypothetical protein
MVAKVLVALGGRFDRRVWPGAVAFFPSRTDTPSRTVRACIVAWGAKPCLFGKWECLSEIDRVERRGQVSLDERLADCS